jgi:hypothetical protein
MSSPVLPISLQTKAVVVDKCHIIIISREEIKHKCEGGSKPKPSAPSFPRPFCEITHSALLVDVRGSEDDF